jgi:hypothetical protein
MKYPDKVIVRTDVKMKAQLQKLAKESKRELSDYLRFVLQDAIDKKFKV